MLPFDVASVVMCDDIRIENNNKFILIGVYNGGILVQGFPAEIVVSWWLQLRPTKIGQYEIEVQVIQDSATLVRALAVFQVETMEWTAMAFPKNPLHLQSAGDLKLQLRLKGDTDWVTAYEFNVRAGTFPGMIHIHPTA